MRQYISVLLLLIASASQASLVMKPTNDPDLIYDGHLLHGNYNAQVTHPDKILGFEIGQRMASPAQITTAIQTWAGQSDRIKVVEYARTHENRPLFAVYLSSPDNLANLDKIQADIAALADPRETNTATAKKIIKRLPATAWMAYSIHGNETSGADAALTAIYHLSASTDQNVVDLLNKVIVVIDPMMNPDGRDRFAKSLEQYRGTAPNVDDQSLLHRGDWPSGRTNHYFFDLNRDFFYLTQPETVGRVQLINRFRPQLMIDGHEMNSQDTYLMGPPRQPLNFNIAPSLQKWAVTFSQDQGAAFDQRNWRYYTGEWFENWYPGYSNYAEYRGSMHILYEQSHMAEDGVRRPEGTVQTYKESVHHQFVSTMANLQTLAKHSKQMYTDYWQDRQFVIDKESPYADRAFVILANQNIGRTQALVDLLLAQDIEVFVADKDFEVDKATNQLGQTLSDAAIPKGSIVIPNRQPEARLLSAIMEFDAQIKPQTLQDERQRILRESRSIMYDTTAWNLTMMYGLDALTVPQNLKRSLTPYQKNTNGFVAADPSGIAWVVNGNDDRSVAFAARLMEQGIQVRALDKAAEFNDKAYPRGSVVVTSTDNVGHAQLLNNVNQTAKELDLAVGTMTMGLGAGDLPDWGGRHFKRLERPQVAIISHDDLRSYDVGATWWSLDHHLGIRHSQIDKAALTRTDLRRYNVLIMPTGAKLTDAQKTALKVWVEQGGTLIAHQSSAAVMAGKDGIGSVKTLDNTLAEAEDFDIALRREWLATQDLDPSIVTMQNQLSQDLNYPWSDAPKRLKEDELKKREKWQKLFMPSGAMVAGRTDQLHWLTFGVGPTLPLLYGNLPVLMSDEKSEAVVRVGVYQAVPENEDTEKQAESTANAWYTLPPAHTIQVRMSGLLWPEAAQRIANSAYLTREKMKNGQVILFAGQPNYRGSTRGTNRLLLNAVVYGPGLGAQPTIQL
ncbi:M14 family metallopeptidase [Aliiglaciecola litoralis]|uniref:M14 family zinc carboxypeptidase n=1 Tax=Aliiglaciecola litoralis TaxID=582857 RepID=A0ABN1LEQ7_9ALTE